MSNIYNLAITYSYNMSLRRLRYFVTVADEGSFTAAARSLHMAQPPLSTQVRQLEHEMGVDLFDRTRRQISLTAAGQALLPEARSLLQRYQQLPQIARRAGAGDTGRLAIGIIPSAANGNLPIALRSFQQQFPAVEISLIEDRPHELIGRLDSGQLDLVLHYSPPQPPHHRGQVLTEEFLLVALPARHRLTARASIPLGALENEPLILPRQHGGEGLYERITRLLAEHGIQPTVAQGDIWLIQTIVGLVAAGAGIALIPATAANLRPDEVQYRAISESTPPLPLFAIWRTDNQTPTIEHFVKQWPTG